MTKRTDPNSKFLKFELPQAVAEDFACFCALMEMPQSHVVKTLIVDFVSVYRERLPTYIKRLKAAAASAAQPTTAEDPSSS